MQSLLRHVALCTHGVGHVCYVAISLKGAPLTSELRGRGDEKQRGIHCTERRTWCGGSEKKPVLWEVLGWSKLFRADEDRVVYNNLVPFCDKWLCCHHEKLEIILLSFSFCLYFGHHHQAMSNVTATLLLPVAFLTSTEKSDLVSVLVICIWKEIFCKSLASEKMPGVSAQMKGLGMPLAVLVLEPFTQTREHWAAASTRQTSLMLPEQRERRCSWQEDSQQTKVWVKTAAAPSLWPCPVIPGSVGLLVAVLIPALLTDWEQWDGDAGGGSCPAASPHCARTSFVALFLLTNIMAFSRILSPPPKKKKK